MTQPSRLSVEAALFQLQNRDYVPKYAVFAEFRHEDNSERLSRYTQAIIRESIYQHLVDNFGRPIRLEKPHHQNFFTAWFNDQEAANRLLRSGTITVILRQDENSTDTTNLQVNLRQYEPELRAAEAATNQNETGYDRVRTEERDRAQLNAEVEKKLCSRYRLKLVDAEGNFKEEVMTYNHALDVTAESSSQYDAETQNYLCHFFNMCQHIRCMIFGDKMMGNTHYTYWVRFSRWPHYYRVVLTTIFLVLYHTNPPIPPSESTDYDRYHLNSQNFKETVSQFLRDLPISEASGVESAHGRPTPAEEAYLWRKIEEYGINRRDFNQTLFRQTTKI